MSDVMDLPKNTESQEPIILHLDLKKIELVDLCSLFQLACDNEQFAESSFIRKAINHFLDSIEAEARNPETEDDDDDDDEEDDDEKFLPDPEF